MYAQNTEKSEKFLENKTLFEELTNVKKKQDKFNLFLNMQGSFDANFRDGFEEGAFKMRQLRIEAKGNINNWLSYRYRQRLNRSNDSSGNIDNLPTSIDIAGIGVKLGKGFSIFAGKQCAAYGGIEFDLNPIEIYEYSDMIENMSNFMTGLNIGYDINSNQQLNLQILDSRNGSFSKTYGVETEDGELPTIESGKLPLVYTLNWNGNFNDVFKTRWSASVMNEAKDRNMYYYAFGNELNLNKFNMFLDFMYSRESIDRKGIIDGNYRQHGRSQRFRCRVFFNGNQVELSLPAQMECFCKRNVRNSISYQATRRFRERQIPYCMGLLCRCGVLSHGYKLTLLPYLRRTLL